MKVHTAGLKQIVLVTSVVYAVLLLLGFLFVVVLVPRQIKLSQDQVIVAVGTEHELEWNVEPAWALRYGTRWKTTDPAIAEVRDGKIVARREGETNLVGTGLGGFAFTILPVFTVVPAQEVRLQDMDITVDLDGFSMIMPEAEPPGASIGPIDWESSDPSVVQVDRKGVLRGIRTGNAVVTGTELFSQTSLRADVEIVIPIEEIVLQPAVLELDAGTGAPIAAQILPDNATKPELRWRSDNPRVAMVNENGYVWGHGVGSARVIAATADGSRSTAASVEVAAIETEEFRLEPRSVSMRSGGTVQVAPVFTPSNATYQRVDWSIDDQEIAEVTPDGTVTALSQGSTTLTAATRNQEFTAEVPVIVQAPGDTVTMSADRTEWEMVFVPEAEYPAGLESDRVARVDTALWVGRYPITFDTWNAVYSWARRRENREENYSFSHPGRMGSREGRIGMDPGHPVTMMSWRDAIAWVNALTEFYNAHHGEEEQLELVYYADPEFSEPVREYTERPYVKPGATGFRLPTNDEWELAARYRGDNSEYALEYPEDSGRFWARGDAASGAFDAYTNSRQNRMVAWYQANSDDQGVRNTTHPVGRLRSNQLGIYDMSGNVMEWVFDFDPDSSQRTMRGGGWDSPARELQAGLRDTRGSSDLRREDIGLRIVRTAEF